MTSKPDLFQMKKLFLSLSLIMFLYLSAEAQISKPPVYPGCENETLEGLGNCFNDKLKSAILDEFMVPEIVEKVGYQ